MTTRRYGHLVAIDGGRAPAPASRAMRASRAGGSEADVDASLPSDDPRAEPPVARVVLVLISVAVCMVAASLGTSLPLSLALGAPFLAASLVAPWWAAASRRRYDRDVLVLLARGRADALRPRLQRAIGLRVFGRPDELAARRGAIAAWLGEPRAARAAFARALASYADEDAAPLDVRLGHAHACYALGDDENAEWWYARLLARERSLPRVRIHLAHARIRRGLVDARTIALLDDAERLRDAPPIELALVRALCDARRGRPAIARLRVRDLAPTTDREHALAAELTAHLGRPRRSA